MNIDLKELIKVAEIEAQARRLLMFIKESNAIENIHREPTTKEIKEYNRFLDLDVVNFEDLEKFVSVNAPGHILRNKEGVNVWIGGEMAPPGGVAIVYKLVSILVDMEEAGAYSTHVKYEHLHPFTDGNGRSGRALWLWQTKKLHGCIPNLGFLQSFYYQTLQHARTHAL